MLCTHKVIGSNPIVSISLEKRRVSCLFFPNLSFLFVQIGNQRLEIGKRSLVPFPFSSPKVYWFQILLQKSTFGANLEQLTNWNRKRLLLVLLPNSRMIPHSQIWKRKRATLGKQSPLCN